MMRSGSAYSIDGSRAIISLASAPASVNESLRFIFITCAPVAVVRTGSSLAPKSWPARSTTDWRAAVTAGTKARPLTTLASLYFTIMRSVCRMYCDSLAAPGTASGTAAEAWSGPTTMASAAVTFNKLG